MDLVAIIATIILLSTLLTLAFSFAAYVITRARSFLRERKMEEDDDENEKETVRVFFERYSPGGAYDPDREQSDRGTEEKWM